MPQSILPVQSLIETMNEAGVPAAEQQAILAQIGETVMIDLVASLVEKLPTDRQGDFEAIQTEGDAEKMYFFLHEAVPNADVIAQEAIGASVARFKELAGLTNTN